MGFFSNLMIDSPVIGGSYGQKCTIQITGMVGPLQPGQTFRSGQQLRTDHGDVAAKLAKHTDSPGGNHAAAYDNDPFTGQIQKQGEPNGAAGLPFLPVQELIQLLFGNFLKFRYN